MNKIKISIYNFILNIISKKNIIWLLCKNNLFFLSKLRSLYYKKISTEEQYPYHYFKKNFGNRNALIQIDINDPSHVGQIIDPFWEKKVFFLNALTPNHFRLTGSQFYPKHIMPKERKTFWNSWDCTEVF